MNMKELTNRVKRGQKIRDVYYLYAVECLGIEEIMSHTGICRTTVYDYIHTFESEPPQLAAQMSKKGKDLKPEDYQILLSRIKELESQLSKSKLEADFYKEMVAYGEEVYGIDLKKAGTK